MGRNPTATRCEDCERRRDEEMTAEHDLDRIAAMDPQLSGGHQWSTDAEWVEFLNSQEGQRP